MQDEIAIQVSQVHKTFRLPHEKQTSLKGMLVAALQGKRGYEQQHVLDGVTFDIKKGEFFGIVGRNGSGKSTLLKVLAGIYTPDSGAVHLNGRLTPFIELGVGFNPELSGRDNVFLNGALLGYSRKDMIAKYDDIVRFAELERFMDQKLKNYSSGMQVRLAFSIAIQSDSEILLFDEVLAVGDERFQKKCVEVFRDLKKQGRTIVLVTHDMGNVERFCDRALVLDKSKTVAVTTPAEAAMVYAKLNVDQKAIEANNKHEADNANRLGNGNVRVRRSALYADGKKTNIVQMGQDLTLEIELDRKAGFKDTIVTCGLAFFNPEGIAVIGPNNEHEKPVAGATKVSFTLPKLTLTPGDYAVTIAVYDKDSGDYYDLLDRGVRFSIIADHVTHGVVEIPGVWQTK